MIKSIENAVMGSSIEMVMCSQGGIGRVAAKGEWLHPFAILGYLLGAAPLDEPFKDFPPADLLITLKLGLTQLKE